MLGLPLFGDTLAEQAMPQNDEAADIRHLEAVARGISISGFAYFQDETAMRLSFQLHAAAKKIYGKGRDVWDSAPPHVLEHLRLASEAGSRAMSAAEYREDTNAELNDRINEWTAELSKPAKKHGGKKAKRKAEDDEFESEPGDEDLNRQILQEWLAIALEERARRAGIPDFNHLADIEQRAVEKFGEDGLALIQRYVAQALAYEDDHWNEHDEILVNGKCLPVAYEAMKTLRQGDSGAAERFVDVLAKARVDQHAGYPEGMTVTFAPASRRHWTNDECAAFVNSLPGGIVINGVALDLAEYDISSYDFPVEYALTPDKSAACWAQQFADALASADSDAERSLLGSLDFARIDVPIVAVFRSGLWHIIDGNKRLASRFYCRLEHVPAIWIVPKRKARTYETSHQTQLLDYECELEDSDDVEDDAD